MRCDEPLKNVKLEFEELTPPLKSSLKRRIAESAPVASRKRKTAPGAMSATTKHVTIDPGVAFSTICMLYTHFTGTKQKRRPVTMLDFIKREQEGPSARVESTEVTPKRPKRARKSDVQESRIRFRDYCEDFTMYNATYSSLQRKCKVPPRSNRRCSRMLRRV